MLVIIKAGFGGDAAWNNVYVFICQYLAVPDGEGLLENDRIHIGWGGVSAKAKVPKAVRDVFAAVFFDALQHMGVMPYD